MERVEKMQTLPITVVIAVKNEAANLPKCLASLVPARRVVVADSQSTDGSIEIACSHGAEVVQFSYAGGYPKKRQWALNAVGIGTPWTLLLDADELAPPEFWTEVAAEIGNPHPAAGYLIRKGFHFLGRRFRFGGFSHDAVLLFQTGRGRFEQLNEAADTGLDMEVHERIVVDGPIRRLRAPLIHEDYKGLAAYLDRHNRYSTWEANLRREFLSSGRWGEDTIRPRVFGNSQERRRFLKQIALRMPCESLLWFLYHYFIRLGILEGRAGLIACRIRSDYIAQVRAKMYELRQRNATES
jgi:glycosyltransferase involved in cell wall biosynthesis